jgi:hypothetical protein
MLLAEDVGRIQLKSGLPPQAAASAEARAISARLCGSP